MAMASAVYRCIIPIRHICKLRVTVRYDRNIARVNSISPLMILSRPISSQSNKSIDSTPVFKNALTYGNKIAIKDEFGDYSYQQIYNGAMKMSQEISKICGRASNSNIAFLCGNSALYTVIQWACWMSGNVAVPLSHRHPSVMQDYFIKDTKASMIITIPQFETLLKPIASTNKCPLVIYENNYVSTDNSTELSTTEILDDNFYSQTAMILYTSGTTGLPKGAAISHSSLNAQIESLTHAWKITEKDNLLHVLPLNHVHGIVNALMCPLKVGATTVMHPKFDSAAVWSALLNVSKPSKDQVNVFMAVPTIYSFLISEYEKVVSKKHRMEDYIRKHCVERIRLMVSGSAPLPSSVFDQWHAISGHKLLERYGMTEIGMALSNPYFTDKVRDRIPGKVGLPLPGVEVKLLSKGKTVYRMKGEYGTGIWSEESLPIYKNDQTNDINVSGELFVRGPNLFTEYINRKEETEQSFSTGGWFRTGDEAHYGNGTFKILGRTSVDIIKTGGFKVSALDVETQLLQHADIKDVCVIGVPDLVWGQKIAAIIVSDKINGNEKQIENLKQWCNKNMTSYEIPSVFKFVEEVPRNPLGKVNKKDILKTFEDSAVM